MNKTQLKLFREAVDCQIALRQTVLLLSQKFGPAQLPGILKAMDAFAAVKSSSADISNQEIVGTLEHIERVRRETTPPVPGDYEPSRGTTLQHAYGGCGTDLAIDGSCSADSGHAGPRRRSQIER